ncbi:hypothetical protein BDV93DRAFT_545948 [Ceratobasidium sp. AG-I]|nr:hypothetical protein BDV93DRAFT_545948 [Ceratobasidium sp. AG-I]
MSNKGGQTLDIFRRGTEGSKTGVNVNAILEATPSHTDEPREVFIGFTPMQLHKTMLGSLIGRAAGAIGWSSDKPPPPNPTYHWAVIVGDYLHELSYDDGHYNTYENKNAKEYMKTKPFKLFPVGNTQFNDWAIWQAGEKAIAGPPMVPIYNVWNNNCQSFVIELLNLICGPDRTLVLTNQLKYRDGDKERAEKELEAATKEARDQARSKAEDLMNDETPLLNMDDLEKNDGVVPDA